jgi:hypothetical protein
MGAVRTTGRDDDTLRAGPTGAGSGVGTPEATGARATAPEPGVGSGVAAFAAETTPENAKKSEVYPSTPNRRSNEFGRPGIGALPLLAFVAGSEASTPPVAFQDQFG